MSREYKEKRIVIYPQYIDSRKSRSEGRKIPLSYAVPSPKVEEIVRAAEKLGLNPIVEESKYPREWWASEERVIVDKKDSKLKTLKLIAEKIREMRGKKY